MIVLVLLILVGCFLFLYPLFNILNKMNDDEYVDIDCEDDVVERILKNPPDEIDDLVLKLLLDNWYTDLDYKQAYHKLAAKCQQNSSSMSTSMSTSTSPSASTSTSTSTSPSYI